MLKVETPYLQLNGLFISNSKKYINNRSYLALTIYDESIKYNIVF
jgi:Tfp pilus assembly protein PilZ